MSFVICKMKIEDTKQVQDMAIKSWSLTYKGIIPDNIQEDFLKAAYSDERMEKRLNVSFIFMVKKRQLKNRS